MKTKHNRIEFVASAELIMQSPLGSLLLIERENRLTEIRFLKNGHKQKTRNSTQFLLQVKKQLEEYFNGQRKTFSIPIELVGTKFQESCWKILQNIPYGQSITYKQEAQFVGVKKGYRAVGSANGKNPIPIIVPCHRVISSNGKLGGYSGGLKMKKFLLSLEADQTKN